MKIIKKILNWLFNFGELKLDGSPISSPKVINTITGEIFNSGKEASDKLRIPMSTLRAKLIGTRTNDTPLIYLS